MRQLLSHTAESKSWLWTKTDCGTQYQIFGDTSLAYLQGSLMYLSRAIRLIYTALGIKVGLEKKEKSKGRGRWATALRGFGHSFSPR